jgi:hypothetical protein
MTTHASDAFLSFQVRDASVHHLVISILQGRNLVPSTATGAQVNKFTPYVIASYGGVERRTSAVAGPSGSVVWDQHLVFPALPTPQPLLLLLFSASSSKVGADRCVGKLQATVPGITSSATVDAAAGGVADVINHSDDDIIMGDDDNGNHIVRSNHHRDAGREPAALVDVPLCHAEWLRLAPATQAEQDALATR